MEALHETKDVFGRYRRTEPTFLIAARGIVLLIIIALLAGYFAILTIFLVSDGGVITSNLEPSPIIPIPDGSESTPEECSPYVLQPSCNNSTSDDRWHGYFTATEGLMFNQKEKRYAMYFTIYIDDPRYVRDNDKGMLIKAFDSEFNPITVPLSVNESAYKIDGEFFQSLDDLNLHVIGFQQMNWMFMNRHIRRKEVSNFWTILGIPPSHFEEKYITTKYESVTNPGTAALASNQTITGQQFYANLFVGTMNWFQNVETEGNLLAGFYGLLIGIYILCFGFAPVHPWGLCQSFFLRRRVKQELHKKEYPKAIPLIERPRTNETLTERIDYLEQFLKQFFCDVSFMEDLKEERELDDAENKIETIGKCEQSYTSLEYLKTKFFRREDYSNTDLANSIMNLIRSSLLANSSSNGDPIDLEYLNKLFQSLINFIMVRKAQIAIYRAIPNYFSDINSEYLIREIESVITKATEKKSCEDLSPLTIGAEGICSNQTYPEKSNEIEEPVGPFVAIQNFFTGQERQARNIKRGNVSPNNMQWLDKFLSNLTAKMTLYFMNILLEREKKIGGDSKTLWRKFSDDYNYQGLIRSFRGRSGAHSIALLYEITDDVPFCQDGYSCTTTPCEKPTGIDSFPCIYSFPEEQPKEHWQNIISFIQEKDEKKQTPFTRSFPIHSFDKNTGCAYYFIRIDDHVLLVVLFTEKHSSPDNSISEFIMLLANRLSGIDVLINLQKFGE
ncbi:13846_t:CDS:10 [Cetraspora pellucida]|uniref:13846_t:CDS:1 n=1 Tax=Cetraspora pellucida TaxID=1433469 RepID=A0A9N9F5N0_9GLOM|nr:13846_t:CDS:10 [Cetraspora pellucida]